MSKLEELIQELCPNGVEHVELKEICKFQNGFAFKSTKFCEKGEPILRITNINSGKLTDDGYVCFNNKDYKENLDNYKVEKNSIVVAMSGATTGKIGFNYSDNIYYLNQRVGMFKPKKQLNNRYLYHWLLSKTDDIMNVSSGSGAQPNLSSVRMMQFQIPLPPLPVQEEIVRILDNFTELTAELTAELAARKKQCEYYRDSLLTFGDDVEWERLSSCCLSIADGDHQAPPKSECGIPFITISNINNRNQIDFCKTRCVPQEYYDNLDVKRKPQIGDVLYSVVGSFGIPVYIGNELQFAFQRHIAILRPNKQKLCAKYLYHVMKGNRFYKQADALARGAAQRTVSLSSLNGIKIPLPSLAEQQRIVDILDRFDTFCNDISFGLPAEIKARQQQYEYYRDKLLTFKEKGA